MPQSEPGRNTPGVPLSPSVVSLSASSATPNGGQSVVMPSSSSASDGGNAANSRRLPSGTVLSSDRYRIERLIASGGMGAVYRALDTRFCCWT